MCKWNFIKNMKTTKQKPNIIYYLNPTFVDMIEVCKNHVDL